MTLTKKALACSLDSMRILATDKQKTAILERFATEPFPYEWTEEDVFIQIRSYFSCGEFVK